MIHNEYNKLLESLYNICIDFDNRFDINTGGCMYLAYCISKCCDKYNIEYNVLMSMYDDSDIPYHIAIEIDDFIINESCYDDGYIMKYLSNQINHKILYKLYKRWLPYAMDGYKKYHNTEVHKTVLGTFKNFFNE